MKINQVKRKFELTLTFSFRMLIFACMRDFLVKYITFRLRKCPELSTIAWHVLENPFAKNCLEATAALTNAMKNCHLICEMLLSAMEEEGTTIAVSFDA